MRILLIICQLSWLLFTGTVSTGTENSRRSLSQIDSPDRAVELTREYIKPEVFGLPNVSEASGIAHRKVLSDCTLPNLADSINGRNIWIVWLEDIHIQGRKGSKDIEVILDEQTGKLVEIRMKSSDADFLSARFDSLKQYTHRLPRQEVYHALPDQVPVVPLEEAMIRCKNMPLAAQFTLVQYVNHSQSYTLPKEDTVRSVWSITYTGAPGGIASSGSRLLNNRTIGKAVVDAISGELILEFWWTPPKK